MAVTKVGIDESGNLKKCKLPTSITDFSELDSAEYLSYPFGRFRIEENGDLSVDFYGTSTDDSIAFNEDGEIVVNSTSSPKINLGKGRITFKGEYDASTTYGFYDCVKNNGSWWLHIGLEETTGNEPTEDNEVWIVFGQKGDDGTTISNVNVNVGSNTGTPSGSGSVSGSTLTLSFDGLKGETGSKGEDGTTPTLSIGTVTTGAAGSFAAVTMGGTAPNYTLNFTIPQGTAGTNGTNAVFQVFTSVPTTSDLAEGEVGFVVEE